MFFGVVKGTMDPMASFIIPVKNEREGVQKCLSSILNQTQRNFEVIVVDGGSTDGTVEVIESFIEGYGSNKVKLLLEPGRGPGYAKNLGLKVAKGEIIFLIDADDLINGEFLEKCASHFRNPGVVGVITRVKFESRGGFWGRVQDTWHKLRWTRETTRFPVVYRRNFLVRIGGFNPDLTVGEDYDLWRRVKKHMKENEFLFPIEKGAVYIVTKENTISDILRHSRWFGLNLINYLKVHPKEASKILLWTLINVSTMLSLIFLSIKVLSLPAKTQLFLYFSSWIYLLTRSILKKRKIYWRYFPFCLVLQLLTSIGLLFGLTQETFKVLKAKIS